MIAGLTLVLLRAILRLYPAKFRDRFAADVADSVRGELDRAAAQGVLATIAAATRALADAIGGIVPEHRGAGESVHPLRGLGADARDAVRSLTHASTFTTVAIAVLALGIGAGTAIFSVVDAVVLRGLPFDEHDRIVAVLEHNPKRQVSGSTMPQIFLDWRERQQTFAQLAALNRVQYRVRNGAGGLDSVRGMRVTREFFPVLRVEPALGRAFGADDEIDGQHRRAILSYPFWQARFGGAADVVGRRIEVNSETWEIAGVMPRGFSYPVGSAQPVDLFTPLAFRQQDHVRGGARNYQFTALGRLKDGVSIEQAGADMSRVAAAVDAEHPGWNTLNPGGGVRVLTLHELMVGRVRSWMLMLLGAVTLLLLIACANVANLMLARATVRGREMGLRAVLGASRWRLTRALLVEGVLLSLAAAGLGILLSVWGVRVLKAWMPDGIPRVATIAIDMRVLFATVAASIVTGVAFGLVPAFNGARPNLVSALRSGGRSATAGTGTRRLRAALVIVEVALAVVLVVGASLFTASFLKVTRIDPGFEYRGILALMVGVRIEPGKFQEAVKQGRPYVERMIEAVRAVPGVGTVTAVSGGLPLSGGRVTMRIEIPGRARLKEDDAEIDTRVVTPDYLQMLRIPLLRGRYITADDREGTPAVALINQTAARKYFGTADPIGQHVIVEGKDRTIIGIVGDIRHDGPEIAPQQEAYVAMAQDQIVQATLVMRPPAGAAAVLPAVKDAIWSINRDQTLYTDRVTLDAYMDGLIAQRRFNMALLALFGVLGLVIAAAGVYGVMAYVVSQRTREIGVRMALGASRKAVVRMVLTSSGVLVATGLAVGSIGAWYLGRVAQTFLFQLDAHDPRAFAGAIVCLAGAALLATFIPARRAASVDPMIALRAE
jgi:putative ABC transport system permease protein